MIETALSGSPATSTDLAFRLIWLSPICARYQGKRTMARPSLPWRLFQQGGEIQSVRGELGFQPRAAASTIDAVPVMFCNTESTTRSLIRKPVIRWSASTSAASPTNLSLSPAGWHPGIDAGRLCQVQVRLARHRREYLLYALGPAGEADAARGAATEDNRGLPEQLRHVEVGKLGAQGDLGGLIRKYPGREFQVEPAIFGVPGVGGQVRLVWRALEADIGLADIEAAD